MTKIKASQRFKEFVCGVLGHSRLLTNCMGYKNCARCGVRLGDSLTGSGDDLLINGYWQIGSRCTCYPCLRNWKNLRWRDKFLCPPAKWGEGVEVPK